MLVIDSIYIYIFSWSSIVLSWVTAMVISHVSNTQTTIQNDRMQNDVTQITIQIH